MLMPLSTFKRHCPLTIVFRSLSVELLPPSYAAFKYLLLFELSSHPSQSSIAPTCCTRSKVICDGLYVHASTIFFFLLIYPIK